MGGQGSDGKRGPLAGYRVLDISQMIAGPVGCLLLADMGAEVIKVEPIDGESTRHFEQIVPHEAPAFILFNRGKRGIPLDLRLAEGREVLRRLVRGADAAVVGYRPDVCRRFGLDYETLAAINPRLVYLQNTAFGSKGPLAEQGGYDLIVQSLAGLLAVNQGLDAAGHPRPITPAIADFTTAALIAWAITGGLLARERMGTGQRIETSLLAGALLTELGQVRFFERTGAEALAQSLEQLQAWRAEGKPWAEQLTLRAESTRAAAGNIYYRAYATRDGYISVACLNNPTRVKFLEAVGLGDPRMEGGRLRVGGQASEEERRLLLELVVEAERLLRSRSSEEWLEVFFANHVPAGPLRFPEELFADEQVLANDYIVEVQHPAVGGYKTTAPPVRMEQTPLSIRASAPGFGEHTRAILSELGYDAEQAARLIELGAVACAAD